MVFALLQQSSTNVVAVVMPWLILVAMLAAITAVVVRGGHRTAGQGFLARELGNVWNWVIAGAIAGAGVGSVVGYLLSSSPLVPFDAVITHGATLNGLDALLRPAAEHAFNVMIAGSILGAIVGAIGGFAVGNQISTKVQESSSSATTPLHCPFCKGQVTADLQFCGHCGKSLSQTCQKCNNRFPPNQPFCSACGTRVG